MDADQIMVNTEMLQQAMTKEGKAKDSRIMPFLILPFKGDGSIQVAVSGFEPKFLGLDESAESSDSRVSEWLLVKSPLPIFGIMLSYVALVLVGPKLMENRKPFDLKWILRIYNIFQIYLSFWMGFELLVTAVQSGYDLRCQPVDFSDSPLALRMARVCWWFFFSKVIDLLDTVFFVLRKKSSQVTFLHVYHHCTMVFNWWMGVKYAAGGQSFFCAMLNSYIHVIMYTYYLLSSFGPGVQKYLWWKRYLTQLQLVQFVLIGIHVVYGYWNNCDFPNFLVWAVAFYCISLIVLFSNFYIRSYVKRRENRVQANGLKKHS